jgi:hypothetical protein
MSLGSFTCPNLIKSSMNNVITTDLTNAVFNSKNTELSLLPDNSFICTFKDVGIIKNVIVTGKYNAETNDITCYNELLSEEINGINTLISFALITDDGKTMNCCTLCSNTCYGSNGTLAPSQMNMKCIINPDDSKIYDCIMVSDELSTSCNSKCSLLINWPKKEDYVDIQKYLIDCCKCSLYFRNCCLNGAMLRCNSLNQRLSSLYCN